MSGLRWLSGAKLVGQVFTWAMTIVVIRLLTPQDYGLMAMAVLFTHFFMLLNEMGLGSVLVQRAKLDQTTVRQIFGLVVLVNLTFFVILFLGAPLMADFFDEDRLTNIIRVLALLFIVAIFEIIPLGMLDRELDYKRRSLVSLGASVLGGLMTLTLAWSGWGVWSLVYGNLTSTTLKTLGFNMIYPYFRWPNFSLKGMRKVVSFGGLVTLERAMWFFYTQADVFIVGKLLGKELLGIYSVAMHLSSLVMHKIGGIINDVVLPTFSRVQDEPERISTYLLKAVRLMSLVVFPLFFGMSSVATELVQVLLGDTWLRAGPVLAWLTLVMPLRILSNLLPPALQGIGRPDASVVNLILAMLLMPAAFIIAVPWGLMGVSYAWVIVFPIVFVIMVSRSAPMLNMTLGEFILAMSAPALCSAVMYAAVLAAKMALGESLAVPWRLLILILVGVAVYLALTFVVLRERVGELMDMVRR